MLKKYKMCIICNKKFIKKYKNQKCCSERCSKINKETYHKIHHPTHYKFCKVCNTKYVPNSNNQVYCNKKCYKKAMLAIDKTEYQKSYLIKRRKADPNFKLICYLRNRIYSALKQNCTH
jgi:hypothetical protein